MASIVIGIDVVGRLHNIEAKFKNLNNRHVYTSIYLHNFEKQQIQLKLLGINITYTMSPVNEQDTSGANAMMSMARGELINTVNSTGRSNSSSSGKSASRQSRGGMARGGGGRDEIRRINERNGERTDRTNAPRTITIPNRQNGTGGSDRDNVNRSRSVGSTRSDKNSTSTSGTINYENNESYVTRERYLACADLGRVHRTRAEELNKRVHELESQLESATTTNYGRNNITKRKWVGSDVTNMDNLNKWLRGKLFPLCKFLPKNWKNYTARDGTLCARILTVVKLPRSVVVKDYWDSRIVPMVNKKYVEMRSNINSSCRKEYQRSEFLLKFVN